MFESIAIALVQASRWGLLVGLAALPVQEPEPADTAEAVTRGESPAQQRPELREEQSIAWLGARPWIELPSDSTPSLSAATGPEVAAQDSVPPPPRTSIAGNTDEAMGTASAGSGQYGAFGVLRSLSGKRRNISVTVWPSNSGWLNGPSSVQAEILISTPTGFAEKFFVQIPSPLPTTPQPLLVVFHKYGSSHLDVTQNTELADEANARGWFLVSPLGGSKKHFSSIVSQVNTEWVFQWLMAGYGSRIDAQRIYGVGFSMGGGAVSNYAARHLDPSKPMFAALVNHSGGVALTNTYYHEIPIVRDIFDFWFGDGTAGSADPWQMARSSIIDFDPITLVTSTDNDLARNLMHIPMQLKRAAVDAIPYVNDQTDALHQHMLNLGKVVGPDYSFDFVPAGTVTYGHSWDMLDFSEVCDWLSQYSLQIPQAANTLADRDGVYFHFGIEQDAPGAFTPFSWSVEPAFNALVIEGTANLARVTVQTQSAGLDPAQILSLTLGTQDGLPDEVVLTQIPHQPTLVLRDAASTNSWTYDSVAQTLTLTETDGAAHDWEILP